MLGGQSYSNDLTGWLPNEPTDPDHNLVASWHSYNFNACSHQSCWDQQVAPVWPVPVVAGEIGENDCAGGYINPLTTWLDSRTPATSPGRGTRTSTARPAQPGHQLCPR